MRARGNTAEERLALAVTQIIWLIGCYGDFDEATGARRSAHFRCRGTVDDGTGEIVIWPRWRGVAVHHSLRKQVNPQATIGKDGVASDGNMGGGDGRRSHKHA